MKNKLMLTYLLMLTNTTSLLAFGCVSNQFLKFNFYDESNENSNKQIAFDFMYNHLTLNQQPKLDSDKFIDWKWDIFENRKLLRARTHGFVKMPEFQNQQEYWTLFFRKTAITGIYVYDFHESKFNPGW